MAMSVIYCKRTRMHGWQNLGADGVSTAHMRGVNLLQYTVAVERLFAESLSLARNGPTAHVKRREHDPSVTPIQSSSD